MTVGNGQPSLQLGFSRLGNGGDRIESRSVFIMNRVPFKNSSESNAYYGYGLGVSFNDSRKTVFVGGGGSSGGGSGNGSGSFVVMSSKNTRLGVQLLVGSKLSQSACVELGVRFVGEADGLPLSGATLSFGVKF